MFLSHKFQRSVIMQHLRTQK